MKPHHRVGRAATLIVSAMTAIALLASPAHANTSQGVVAGGGVVTDDWGDEGVMSQSQHRYSGATGMWQYVLWADGAKKGNGVAFSEGEIDCDFGANTAAATRNWQSARGLGADGVVGVNTLSRADNNLRLDANGLLSYVGTVRTVQLGWRADHDFGTYWIDAPLCTCEGATFAAGYGAPIPGNTRICW